jgi:hypothetical protein
MDLNSCLQIKQKRLVLVFKFNICVKVDRGSEVTFQCEVLGNPQPIVRWYHDRDLEPPSLKAKSKIKMIFKFAPYFLRKFHHSKCTRLGGGRIQMHGNSI